MRRPRTSPCPRSSQLSAESPESQLDASQRFVAFCRAVGGLPEQCRRVMILKKVYGLSLAEIADHLGTTQAMVEKDMARGLMMCRDYLEAPAARNRGVAGRAPHRPTSDAGRMSVLAFPDPRKAREEASLWLARLDRGLGDDERASLRDWLRDAMNNRAFLEMGRLWRGLEIISVLSELFPLNPEVLNPQPRRSFPSIALAAIAAACISAVGTLMLAGTRPGRSSIRDRRRARCSARRWRAGVGRSASRSSRTAAPRR